MDQQRRHFRVAPVSRARPQKEDLHLQLKSRAGQKPWQRGSWQTLERGLEKLQTSDRRVPREKTNGESENARKQMALKRSVNMDTQKGDLPG